MTVSEGVREIPAAHSPEIPRRALDLVAPGDLIYQTAHDLEIIVSWLWRHISSAAIESGRKPGLTADEHKQLVELRRRLRLRKMENEFLNCLPRGRTCSQNGMGLDSRDAYLTAPRATTWGQPDPCGQRPLATATARLHSSRVATVTSISRSRPR